MSRPGGGAAAAEASHVDRMKVPMTGLTLINVLMWQMEGWHTDVHPMAGLIDDTGAEGWCGMAVCTLKAYRGLANGAADL